MQIGSRSEASTGTRVDLQSRKPGNGGPQVDRDTGRNTSHDPDAHLGEAIVISCDDCAMQHTDMCDDCLVSFILNREPGDAVVIDAAEARAVRMLAHAGLVPEHRHVRRVG